MAEELSKSLKVTAIKKKCFDEMNFTFLLALNEGFEGSVKALIEKGFPSNANRPIVSRLKKGNKRKYLPVFPSYFMVAVGQGHVKVVESMIKVQLKGISYYFM